MDWIRYRPSTSKKKVASVGMTVKWHDCKVAVLWLWQTLVAGWLQCPDLSPDKCPAANSLLLFFFLNGKQAQQRFFRNQGGWSWSSRYSCHIWQYLVLTNVEMIYPCFLLRFGEQLREEGWYWTTNQLPLCTFSHDVPLRAPRALWINVKKYHTS